MGNLTFIQGQGFMLQILLCMHLQNIGNFEAHSTYFSASAYFQLCCLGLAHGNILYKALTTLEKSSTSHTILNLFESKLTALFKIQDDHQFAWDDTQHADMAALSAMKHQNIIGWDNAIYWLDEIMLTLGPVRISQCMERSGIQF